MSKMIGAPTRYRQGKDELKCLGDDLKDYIKDAYILNDVMGSDHCPIALEIQI